MSIDVSADEKHQLVTLRHARRPDEQGFTMRRAEWDELLWRAACYNLEFRRLLRSPVTICLGDALGGRLVLSGSDLSRPGGQ